jgi:HK97 family phage major capsid protein
MNIVEEYRKWITACTERMDAILTTAQAESRDITADEEAEYTRLDNSIDASAKMLDKLGRVENLKRDLDTRKRSLNIPNIIIKPGADEMEWKCMGEFVHAVTYNKTDRRLLEAREQSMGVGAEGGFAVPAQFRPELLSVEAQGAIIRPRATVIPAGDPPDAPISMPALNQTSAQNMYAGTSVTWIGEGVAKPETDAELLEVTLTPHEVAAHVVLTDKLLRNWGAASAVISGLMRKAVVAAEENAFLSGNGIAKPSAMIGAPGSIAQARATASQISYTDVVNMMSKILMGGQFVWLASQTTLPQLANIRDAGNNNLWIQNASIGAPGSLMGVPLFFMDRAPTLGNPGDLMLADLSYYLIKDGSGPFVDASDQVYFLNNKTVIKVFWNVDGKLWLTEPLQLEGGAATDLISPIVTLT